MQKISNTLSSPWYIQILIAFSAWIASLFLLAFIATMFRSLLQHPLILSILGISMLFFAYTLLKKQVNEFINHSALAISFAGQIIIFIGLTQMMSTNSIFLWIILSFIQILLAWNMPHYLHRLISSYFAVYTLSVFLLLSGFLIFYTPLFMLLIAYIWIREFNYPDKIQTLQAIGYGLVLGLIHIKGSQFLHHNFFFWQEEYTIQYFSSIPYFNTILEGLIMISIVSSLLKTHQVLATSKLFILSILAMILLSILSLKISGLMIGLLIIILGFHHSNRILLSIGFIALTLNISAYYYLLSYTLLEKSLSLFLLGIGLLIARWIIFRFVWRKKEASHA